VWGADTQRSFAMHRVALTTRTGRRRRRAARPSARAPRATCLAVRCVCASSTAPLPRRSPTRASVRLPFVPPLRHPRIAHAHVERMGAPWTLAIRCPALRSYEGASYDAANAGVTATGVCLPGYQANGPAPTLACSLSGEWASTTTDPCQQIVCPAIADDGSTAWPSAVAANPPTLVTGSCLSGFYVMAGAPYRGCDINGTATPVQNPCQGTLAAHRRCRGVVGCTHAYAVW
jgi:hypothetical protein